MERIPTQPTQENLNSEPLEQKRGIVLTTENISQIEGINSAIKTVPAEIIQQTANDVLESIQNGHKLNRLIKNDEGEIVAYMACVDEGMEGVYIKYLASNGEAGLDFAEEIEKTIKRAKKFGYKTIAFDGFNPVLNRFARMQGFHEKETHEMGDIKSTRYEMYLDTPESITDNWLAYLKNQAEETMAKLDQNQANNLKQALLNYASHNKDPHIAHLYGALYTIQNSPQADLLNEEFSIKKLYDVAENLSNINEKARKVNKYSNALITFLQIEDSHIHIQNIQNILTDTAEEKWDKSLRTYLDQNSIIYPNEHTYDDAFLYSLVEREPVNLGSFEINETEKMTILELNTMDQFKTESQTLGHCIGDSDFYINKVRKGEIRVFSIRDKDNTPKYTLEYDIATQDIKQFKGGGDQPVNSLPNSHEMVTKTFSTLAKQNIDVLRCQEKFDYCLLRDEEKNYSDLNDQDFTAEYVIANPDKAVIKGELNLDDSISIEDLNSFCNIEGLTIDLTNISVEKKNTITKVAGRLIDNRREVSYLNLQTVGGYLYANNATTFNAPNLETVDGSLRAQNATTFNAPNLETVGGYLEAWSATTFNAPSLKTVGGDLYAGNATTFNAPNLETVGGYLYAWSATTFNAPNLETVGGYLDANNTTTFNAPNLETVGGFLDAEKAITFNAPSLETVGWYLNAQNATTFNAPSLETVGGYLYAEKALTLDLSNIKEIKGEFRYSDDISVLSMPNSDVVINGMSLQNHPFYTIWKKFYNE